MQQLVDVQAEQTTILVKRVCLLKTRVQAIELHLCVLPGIEKPHTSVLET